MIKTSRRKLDTWKRYYQRNRERLDYNRWVRALRSKFGITVEQYEVMLEDCGGKCEVCGREHMAGGKRLAVDHDHTTGKVRGLLCHLCNRAIGLLGDDSEKLKAASEYLVRHAERICQRA